MARTKGSKNKVREVVDEVEEKVEEVVEATQPEEINEKPTRVAAGQHLRSKQ